MPAWPPETACGLYAIGMWIFLILGIMDWQEHRLNQKRSKRP